MSSTAQLASANPTKPADLPVEIWQVILPQVVHGIEVEQAVADALESETLPLQVRRLGWTYFLQHYRGNPMPFADRLLAASRSDPGIAEEILNWATHARLQSTQSLTTSLGWIGNRELPQSARLSAWQHLNANANRWIVRSETLSPLASLAIPPMILEAADTDIHAGDDALRQQVLLALSQFSNSVLDESPAMQDRFAFLMARLRDNSPEVVRRAVQQTIALMNMNAAIPGTLTLSQQGALLNTIQRSILPRRDLAPSAQQSARDLLGSHIEGSLLTSLWLQSPDHPLNENFAEYGPLPSPFFMNLATAPLAVRIAALEAALHAPRFLRLFGDGPTAAQQFLQAVQIRTPPTLPQGRLRSWLEGAAELLLSDHTPPSAANRTLLLPRFVSMPADLRPLLTDPQVTLAGLTPLLAYPQFRTLGIHRASWTALAQRATRNDFLLFFRRAALLPSHPLTAHILRIFIRRGLAGETIEPFDSVYFRNQLESLLSQSMTDAGPTESHMREVEALEDALRRWGYGDSISDTELRRWWTEATARRFANVSLLDRIRSRWRWVRQLSLVQVITGPRSLTNDPTLTRILLSRRLDPSLPSRERTLLSTLTRQIALIRVPLIADRHLSSNLLKLIRSPYPEFWVVAAEMLARLAPNIPGAGLLAQELDLYQRAGILEGQLNPHEMSRWVIVLPAVQNLALSIPGAVTGAWTANRAIQRLNQLIRTQSFSILGYEQASYLRSLHLQDTDVEGAYQRYMKGYFRLYPEHCVTAGILRTWLGQ